MGVWVFGLVGADHRAARRRCLGVWFLDRIYRIDRIETGFECLSFWVFELSGVWVCEKDEGDKRDGLDRVENADAPTKAAVCVDALRAEGRFSIIFATARVARAKEKENAP